MSETRSRIPAFARWTALPVGLVLSAALVWQASYAAFTATTTNPTNNWTTGTVALTDDDSTTAMFTVTGLKPGSTGEKCIVVTYGGNLTADVKLFGTSASATNELDDWIDLTVTQGTGDGTFAGGCGTFTADGATAAETFTGTLEAFALAKTNSSTGLGNWDPTASGQTKVFKFNYTVNASAPNTVQGSNAQLGFTWEATNT